MPACWRGLAWTSILTQKRPPAAYPGVGFDGLGLLTNHPFDLAYEAAEDFTDALKQRTKAAGFMKTLLLQRICSSFASGKATAEKMLATEKSLDDEEEAPLLVEPLRTLTPAEVSHLRTIIEELSRPEARDPKLAAVRYFLTEHRTEGKTWLEHGCIIFSQYYDTAFWVGAELAKALPRRTRRRLRRLRQERHVQWRATSHPSSARRSRRRSRNGKFASSSPPTPRAKA